MANQQPQTVNIEGTEYEIDSLSDQAKRLIDHVADLDRKAASMDFQREQIQIGRNAAFAMLKEALPEPAETTSE
jgi:cell division protein ZapA (FtsZ GTPase activity inhibitor)